MAIQDCSKKECGMFAFFQVYSLIEFHLTKCICKICAYCDFTCRVGPLAVTEINGKKTINLNINLNTEAGEKI